MAKRMILMLVGVALFVGAVATVKGRQRQMGAAQAASFQPPPEAVTTIVAGRESWPEGLAAIGTAVAIQTLALKVAKPASSMAKAPDASRLPRLDALDWSALAVPRAVRGAVGVTLPLVVGWLTGHIEYGAYTALGALPAGFASFEGQTRTRVGGVVAADQGDVLTLIDSYF